MSTITPFIWYDNQLEEALELYGRVFSSRTVHARTAGPDGSLLWAEFEPAHAYTPAPGAARFKPPEELP